MSTIASRIQPALDVKTIMAALWRLFVADGGAASGSALWRLHQDGMDRIGDVVVAGRDGANDLGRFLAHGLRRGAQFLCAAAVVRQPLNQARARIVVCSHEAGLPV